MSVTYLNNIFILREYARDKFNNAKNVTQL